MLTAPPSHHLYPRSVCPGSGKCGRGGGAGKQAAQPHPARQAHGLHTCAARAWALYRPPSGSNTLFCQNHGCHLGWKTSLLTPTPQPLQRPTPTPAPRRGPGYEVYIKTPFWDGDTDNPAATFQQESRDAARRGAGGLRLNVTKSSSEQWHVMFIVSRQAEREGCGASRGPAPLHVHGGGGGVGGDGGCIPLLGLVQLPCWASTASLPELGLGSSHCVCKA